VPVPKVIDFGIAKATEGRLTDHTVYTQLQQFIGTPAYMSPEQAEMSGLDIDTRSDIYSLGVLLYELLTGRTPLDAKDLMSQGLDAMRKTIREQEPVRPSTRLAALKGEELTTTAKRRALEAPKLINLLKGDLDWIVMKCLEKDRTRRYDTANGLATDLKRHLENQPIVARPPSAAYAMKKFAARNRWPVIFSATAAVLIVAGLVGTSLGLGSANKARIQADQNAARATQLADKATKAEASALQEKEVALGLAYSASMLGACDALQNAQIDAVRHYLSIAPSDLRGWEWRVLSNRLDTSIRVQKRSRPPLSCIHVLPDGRSYYDVGPSNIQRWDMETGGLLATIATHHICLRSWLVASGKKMILLVAGKEDFQCAIETWDLERGTLLSAWPLPSYFSPAPDGSPVAYRQGSNICFFDTSTGPSALSRTTVGLPLGARTPIALTCFQPDGRRLAVEQGLGNIALLDTDSLQVLSSFPAHDNSITCMEFSADSRLLATGSWDSTIRLTDVSVNPPAAVATLRGHTDFITGLNFSPDGALLASSGQDRTLRLWDTRTGLALSVSKSDGDSPRFLPDGQTLMNGEPDGVRFWDVKSLDAWVLRGHRSYLYSVLISPDGGTIYSGGWDGFAGYTGSLRFWDAATGDAIAEVGAVGEYMRAAALSADGSRLAVSIALVSGSRGRIDILETATGKTTLSITALDADRLNYGIDSLAFDPSGQKLACIDPSSEIVHIIDTRTGLTRKSRRMSSPGPEKSILAWSSDGATIAVWHQEESTIALLDGQSLEPIRQWPSGCQGLVNSLTFSPDSHRILTTGDDGMVRVWDAASGTLLHDLVGHANRVLYAAYSPDGQRIASGGFDDNVRIWNAQTFEQVARLGGHQDYVYSLAWRADSQQLLSCSGDHTIRIWDAQPLMDRIQARRERQTILAEVEPMVRRLFATLGDADEVVRRVKADTSLGMRARQVALQVTLRMSVERGQPANALPPK
jgi:WD40 repeat protein